jgi:peptide/nickel transport system permease protein
MWAYLTRRLIQAVAVVFVMAVIVFFGVNVIGNPVDILINPEFTEAEYQQAIRALGLHLPLHEQFLVFIENAMKGDLGLSFVWGEPALKLIAQRLPATFELAAAALILSIVLGIPLGMYAGSKPHSWVSKTIVSSSILGFSLPTFWGDTVLVFGIEWSFLTWDGLTHLALPAVNLALTNIALVIRLSRAGTREVMLQDYIKFARAKGLSQRRITLVHVLKNTLIPVVTVLGLELGTLIAFSVVTETVFAWPGMGKLIIESIQVLDRPVVVAYLMLTVLLFVSINLLVDILYSVIDPRVRISGAK